VYTEAAAFNAGEIRDERPTRPGRIGVVITSKRREGTETIF
jgi:hypothetical protein